MDGKRSVADTRLRMPKRYEEVEERQAYRLRFSVNPVEYGIRFNDEKIEEDALSIASQIYAEYLKNPITHGVEEVFALIGGFCGEYKKNGKSVQCDRTIISSKIINNILKFLEGFFNEREKIARICTADEARDSKSPFVSIFYVREPFGYLNKQLSKPPTNYDEPSCYDLSRVRIYLKAPTQRMVH